MWWNSSEIRTKNAVKTVILSLIFGGLSWIYFNFEATQHWLWQCPIYKTTGLQCATCGFQRAFHQLLHGNIRASLSYNSLFIPTLVVAVGLYYVPKKEYIIKALKWYLIIAFAFMIVRNLLPLL